MIGPSDRRALAAREMEGPVRQRRGELRKCCGLVCTRKIRTLSIALCLFSIIATSQLVGALLARSLALLADTSSMFLDACTYAGNIYAEKMSAEERDPALVRNRMLIASGISFFALLGVSVFFLAQAALLISSPEGSGGGSVDFRVVLSFAVLGLVFDIASLVPYLLYGVRQDEDEDGVGGDGVGGDGVGGGDRGDASAMNMCSALSHILSDTLRSLTTLAEAFVLWFGDFDGQRVDAYASFIVSTLVIIGLSKSIFDWTNDVCAVWRGEPVGGPARTEMRPVVRGQVRGGVRGRDDKDLVLRLDEDDGNGIAVTERVDGRVGMELDALAGDSGSDAGLLGSSGGARGMGREVGERADAYAGVDGAILSSDSSDTIEEG